MLKRLEFYRNIITRLTASGDPSVSFSSLLLFKPALFLRLVGFVSIEVLIFKHLKVICLDFFFVFVVIAFIL